MMSNMCKSRQDNSKRSCDSCLSDCMIRTVQARTQKPKNAFRQLWQQWRQLQAGAIRKQPLPWEPTHPSLSRHLLPEVATVCWRKCKHLSCCCTCYHHESSLSCHSHKHTHWCMFCIICPITSMVGHAAGLAMLCRPSSSFQSQNVYFHSDFRHPCTGNLNSETSGDSVKTHFCIVKMF